MPVRSTDDLSDEGLALYDRLEAMGVTREGRFIVMNALRTLPWKEVLTALNNLPEEFQREARELGTAYDLRGAAAFGERISPNEVESALALMKKRVEMDPDLVDNREFSDRHLDLIERRIRHAKEQTTDRAAPARGMVSPASDRDKRKSELREICRNDPDRYDSDKALQTEWLSLIEADIAARDAPAGSSIPELSPPTSSASTGDQGAAGGGTSAAGGVVE